MRSGAFVTGRDKRGGGVEILMLLIPLSVVLVALIAGVFWWSVKSGQFDDLEGPAHRILADDDCTPGGVDEAGKATRGPPPI